MRSNDRNALSLAVFASALAFGLPPTVDVSRVSLALFAPGPSSESGGDGAKKLASAPNTLPPSAVPDSASVARTDADSEMSGVTGPGAAGAAGWDGADAGARTAGSAALTSTAGATAGSAVRGGGGTTVGGGGGATGRGDCGATVRGATGCGGASTTPDSWLAGAGIGGTTGAGSGCTGGEKA